MKKIKNDEQQLMCPVCKAGKVNYRQTVEQVFPVLCTGNGGVKVYEKERFILRMFDDWAECSNCKATSKDDKELRSLLKKLKTRFIENRLIGD